MPSLVPPQANDGTAHQDRDQLIGLLYQQHYHGLLRYLAARFGRSALDLEDIVQSAFLKLARHSDLRAIADYRAYLFTLACNIAIDIQRNNFRRGAVHDDLHAIATAAPSLEDSSEKILIDRERLTHIEAALARMPKMRRRIFLLIRIEGMSVRDVADRFAMSEAAIYKHVARALQDCAAMLEQSDRKASY
jgi:RNA polymerase sigma-70 factor (ECF subfamily)